MVSWPSFIPISRLIKKYQSQQEFSDVHVNNQAWMHGKNYK